MIYKNTQQKYAVKKAIKDKEVEKQSSDFTRNSIEEIASLVNDLWIDCAKIKSEHTADVHKKLKIIKEEIKTLIKLTR